jgi:uncharacterized protein
MKRRIKYLVLSITDACNLECKYCYRGKCGSSVMTREIIDRSVGFLPENEKCHVQITGGEPGLFPDMIQYAAESVREHAGKASIGLQTNGTIVSREFMDIVKRYEIQLGVSLDGRKEVNDAIRGNTDSVFQGLGRLLNNDIEFRITTVVSNLNVERLYEIPILLAVFGNARGMGLDMLVRKGRAKEAPDVGLPAPDRTSESVVKLIKTLDYVNRERSIPITLRETEKVNSAKKGEAYCHAVLGESLAVTPHGGLFACGQAIGDPGFLCGNLNDLPGLLAGLDSYVIAGRTSEERWDCPSRKHYNKNETWPDIHKIITHYYAEKEKHGGAHGEYN